MPAARFVRRRGPARTTAAPRLPAPAAGLVALVVGLAACESNPPGPAPEDLDPQATPAELEPVVPIRPEVSGQHGAVVAGHPLAAQAGYQVLRAGGTATDAAVTMAAILAVVRPHMNGVGGDAFALFHDAATREVRVLNGSGRAAALADPAFFAARELESMPGSGAMAVTVPGAVSAWAAALEASGTLSLADALAPAIRLAEEGFVVTPTLARDLAAATRLNDAGQAIYAPGGTPLAEGQILRNPALAQTLRLIGSRGPGVLYGGEVGRRIAEFIEAEGGPLRIEDFAAHQADWVDPIGVEVLGRTVHTVPPNSQGIALLQTLGIVNARGLEGKSSLSPLLMHELIEARKLAFADRDRWVADPATNPAPVDRLLDPDYLAERAALISELAMDPPEPGFDDVDVAEGDGDTVYLMAVDANGNAVSWIQSLFSAFGSGLVEPETGVVLQNRGAGFTLADGHPNRIAPGKRPFHTLMATMVTGPDGAFELAVGTPGGHGQSQSIAQGILHLLHSGLGPQAAVEAPRFRGEDGRIVQIEARYPATARAELERRGHELQVREGWTAPFGNLQMIWRTPDGVLRTGADMRREGAALAW